MPLSWFQSLTGWSPSSAGLWQTQCACLHTAMSYSMLSQSLLLVGFHRVWVNWASTKAGWRRRRRLLQQLAKLREPALQWGGSCPATCAPPLPPRLCRRCAATSRLLSSRCASLLILLVLSKVRHGIDVQERYLVLCN